MDDAPDPETNPDAYRWWRLYQEAARQLTTLYAWGAEQGIDLPSPGAP